MRHLGHLDKYRSGRGKFTSLPGDPFGAFMIPRNDLFFFVVACQGYDLTEGWDHVSVHLRHKRDVNKHLKRCPTWEEMCWLKDQFFEPEETVVQFHPPKSDYVNIDPYVLHLWAHKEKVTLPPKLCV